MKVKQYKDIDYATPVPEDMYIKLYEEATRLSAHGANGSSAFIHEIDSAHFRYANFGRRPELEQEIVGRTMVAEEMF